MILKAPIIITMEGPVLKDHAIVIEGEQIKAILPQREVSGEAVDLPETILLPGLINAHCHLELSQLPQKLTNPGTFTAWVQQLGALKLQMSVAQTEAAIQEGIRQVIDGGTTTIADHISSTTSPKTLLESPLDGVAYIEVLGVERERAKHFYNSALRTQQEFSKQSHKIKVQATPHATFSLLPEIFADVLLAASEIPFSIHIAESPDEDLLFREQRGPLYEFLKRLGKPPTSNHETPLRYLKRLGLLPNKCMAIHGNYLEDEDIEILLENEMSVVHCPGSHAYFGYDRFPLGMLLDCDVNVALGTDSLASNNSLSMFEQMRLALDAYAELTPETVLKMATLNGAKALRRENEIGSLKPGKLANIVGVPRQRTASYENIVTAKKLSFVS
ncbi:MAG: amidohydrolase family protein [Deltaproteobacteria bacterium]|nr:amidohydrolase family protein [Deltaproteobacteria bacterium]